MNQQARSLTPDAFVDALYRKLLGPGQDRSGHDDYAGLIRAGHSVDEVLARFVNSTEFLRRLRTLVKANTGAQPVPSSTAAATPSKPNDRPSSQETETLNRETLIDTFVEALYRKLLGREPDRFGLNIYANLIRSGESADEVLTRFVNSPEFMSRVRVLAWQARVANYHLSDEQLGGNLEQLFDRTAEYWRSAGGDADAIYYSVLSAQENRQAKNEAQRKVFIDTGIPVADFYLDKTKTGTDRPLETLDALEIGAGVGRLSLNLAGHFKRFVAADFSGEHLEELKRNAALAPKRFPQNIEPLVLEHVRDFERLPPSDVIISHITLQHNTPPVQAYMVEQLLGSLKPAGCALLHIVIHDPFYNFSPEAYLRDPRSGKDMEMHILPRENLRDIAGRNDCRIADSYGFGGTRGVYSEVFRFQKSP